MKGRGRVPAVARPVLTEADLAMVLAQCDRRHDLLDTLLSSRKALLGPFASPWLGCGFEYQESRPYQPGDPLRRLDWRYFARTRRLYTRLHEQERQARLLLVVDLRQPMRYGSKVRLKAAQAIRLAVALAHQAAGRGQPVQVLALSDGIPLSPVWRGRAAAQQTGAWLNRPLPPDVPTPDDWSRMQAVVEQMPAGTQVIAIGHLWDLPRSLARWLGMQSPWKPVTGVWIEDVTEHRPPSGRVTLAMDGMRLVPEAGIRARLDAARRRQLRALVMEGMRVFRLRADEEWFACEPVELE